MTREVIFVFSFLCISLSINAQGRKHVKLKLKDEKYLVVKYFKPKGTFGGSEISYKFCEESFNKDSLQISTLPDSLTSDMLFFIKNKDTLVYNLWDRSTLKAKDSAYLEDLCHNDSFSIDYGSGKSKWVKLRIPLSINPRLLQGKYKLYMRVGMCYASSEYNCFWIESK